jgi:hypothetical protein
MKIARVIFNFIDLSLKIDKVLPGMRASKLIFPTAGMFRVSGSLARLTEGPAQSYRNTDLQNLLVCDKKISVFLDFHFYNFFMK